MEVFSVVEAVWVMAMEDEGDALPDSQEEPRTTQEEKKKEEALSPTSSKSPAKRKLEGDRGRERTCATGRR